MSLSPVLAVEAAGLTDGELWRSLLAIVVVFGLLGALAWAARRGRLGFFTRQPSHVRVEATVPLGERRSLMVVAIEGRRLLLGLTPMQVSLVTELTTAPVRCRAGARRSGRAADDHSHHDPTYRRHRRRAAPGSRARLGPAGRGRARSRWTSPSRASATCPRRCRSSCSSRCCRSSRRS